MGGTYSPQSLGITAPSGGFQQGGWYSGRQYYNGTLSDPGAIHPQSPQQGAGQTVSPEVIQATNPANLTYINEQRALSKLTPITGNAAPPAPAPVAPGGATDLGSGGNGSLLGPSTPALDLPGLYKTLSDQAGLSDLEKELTDKQTAFNTAQSQINNNPFLSEANRVGRVSKLTTDYNNDIKTTQDALATKKADIETQIGLATKQFDINSQAATQALNQFNSLLNSGALKGASGSDIAAITRATGISSTMIQAALDKQKQSDVKPQVITNTDNAGNVTVSVIDANTGNIINEQSLGTIGTTKKTTGGTGTTALQTKTDLGASLSDYYNNTKTTINGRTGSLQTLISPEDLYKLLSQEFPESISSIPKPAQIRKITGQ